VGGAVMSVFTDGFSDFCFNSLFVWFLISIVVLVVVEKKAERCKGNAKLYLGREVQQD